MPVVNKQQELFFRSSGNRHTKLRRCLYKKKTKLVKVAFETMRVAFGCKQPEKNIWRGTRTGYYSLNKLG